MNSLGSQLVEMLWAPYGQNQMVTFEVQVSQRNRRTPSSYAVALAALRSGSARFFGPVPRKTPGNSKSDCVDEQFVLYVDVDRPDEDRQAVLGDVVQRTEVLGLPPSAIVYSGRAGFHVYWVLEQSLSTELAQGYNKALAQELGGDPSCWDCTRLLRVPGTINEKAAGGPVELIEMTGKLHPLAALDALGPVVPTSRERSHATRTATRTPAGDKPEWLLAADSIHGWEEKPLDLSTLLGKMLAYMQELPARGWTDRSYKSRSEMEAAIVYRLARRGASDAQIKHIADQRFARHREEQDAHPDEPDGYLEATIAKARKKLFEDGLVSSPEGGWPRKTEPKKRHLRHAERRRIVPLIQGQTRAQAARTVSEELGRPRRSAYRDLSVLVAEGLIDIRDGRAEAVEVLT